MQLSETTSDPATPARRTPINYIFHADPRPIWSRRPLRKAMNTRTKSSKALDGHAKGRDRPDRDVSVKTGKRSAPFPLAGASFSTSFPANAGAHTSAPSRLDPMA